MSERLLNKRKLTNLMFSEFKTFYRDLHKSDLSRLDTVYTDDVIFKDPIHQIKGITPLQDYMAGLCLELTECRFEYLDELASDTSAYIKWVMHFRHPRFNNRPIQVRGMTHIQFDHRGIHYHEDIYDMGSMLYEQLPILGAVIRWLKQRLAR